MPDYDILIVVYFKGNAVTVSFDAGEGTVEPASIEVNAGEAVGELPTPIREGGWKFIGWFAEPAESDLLAGQGIQVTAETID